MKNRLFEHQTAVLCFISNTVSELLGIITLVFLFLKLSVLTLKTRVYKAKKFRST